MGLTHIPALPASTSGSTASLAAPKAGADASMQSFAQSSGPSAAGADPRGKAPGQDSERAEQDTQTQGGARVPLASRTATAEIASRDGESLPTGSGDGPVSAEPSLKKTLPEAAKQSKKNDGKDLPLFLAAFPFSGAFLPAVPVAGPGDPFKERGTTAADAMGRGLAEIAAGRSDHPIPGDLRDPLEVVARDLGRTASSRDPGSLPVAGGGGPEILDPSTSPLRSLHERTDTQLLESLATRKIPAALLAPGFAATLSTPSSTPNIPGQVAGASAAGTIAAMGLPLPLSATPVTLLPAAPTIPVPVSVQGPWAEALGQQVQWMLGQHLQQVTLQLHPAHLGPLEVHLDLRNTGEANALFISAHADVRAAIQAAVPQLQQSFAAMGLQLGQASVDSGSGRPFGDDGRWRRPTATTRSAPDLEPVSSAPLATLQGLVNTFV